MSFRFSYLLYIWILIYTFGILANGADISWTMAHTPIKFGETAYLLCEIAQQESCKIGIRQWFGSSSYKPLCQNSNCRDPTKYETMTNVTNRSSMCLYVLMIHNFSENDVNCDYTCSHGIKQERKHLIINPNDFEYIPMPHEVETNISSQANSIVVRVHLLKVFPAPNCSTELNEGGEKRAMTVATITLGVFFEAFISGQFLVSFCKGTIRVICHIGKSSRSILDRKINFCIEPDNHRKNQIVSLIVIGILVFGTSACFVVIKYRKTSKLKFIIYCKFHKRYQGDGTQAEREEIAKKDIEERRELSMNTSDLRYDIQEELEEVTLYTEECNDEQEEKMLQIIV